MGLERSQLEQLEDRYRELVKFYTENVKEVIIASERYQRDQRISISAINEIRSAFDHVARAAAVMYGLSPTLEEAARKNPWKYCDSNLDKARGHLYRAAYDAYDAIAIGLIREIEQLLENVSHTALYTVIPDAARLVHGPFHEARALVTKAKTTKDVASAEEEEGEFAKYEKAAVALHDVREQITRNMAQIARIEQQARLSRATSMTSAVLAASVGVVASLVAVFFMFPGVSRSAVSVALAAGLVAGGVGVMAKSLFRVRPDAPERSGGD